MFVCLSVRMEKKKNSAPTGRIVINFDIGVFFEKSVEKMQFFLNI